MKSISSKYSAFLTSFLLSLPLFAVAHTADAGVEGCLDGFHMMGFAPWGSAGLGMVFMVLFWILVIIGIFLLIKWLLSQGGGAKESTALEILKERYAKGEIDKEEFERRKKDLTK